MALSKSLTHVYSEGEKRHFRMLSMINEEGQETLKSFLDKQLAGSSLKERLAEPSVKSHIDDAFSKKVIKKDQYNRLYPSSGAIETNCIDLTLHAFLIRQLHPYLNIQNKVWINPSHGDLSPEADVTRLKLKRNILVHSGKTVLTVEEFEVEFQELEMILCRLVRYAGNVDLTVDGMVQRLSNKKNGLFDRKPASSHVATSTSSSLDKVSSHVATSTSSSLDKVSVYYSDSDSIKTLPSIENIECGIPSTSTKEVRTSTSSLEKKRKLSFKVKSYIEPFVTMSQRKGEQKENEVNPVCNTPLPKRMKSKDKKKLPKRNCRTCSCALNGSCGNQESNVITTNDHSSQPYRCNISGISVLDSGALVLTDSSHDIVQVITPVGEVIDEFECLKPYSVVALSGDKFAVTMRSLCKVVVLELDETVHSIQLKHEFEVGCGFWLSDIKYFSGYLYTLCENGDLHIIDANTGNDSGIICTNLKCASHFDIAQKGCRFFITHGQNITCLDEFGNKIWSYSDKEKRAFKSLIVKQNKVFVCDWERDKVITLKSKSGKYLKEYSDEHMRNPWSLCLQGRKLYVSQFMSELNSQSCREVIVIKL